MNTDSELYLLLEIAGKTTCDRCGTKLKRVSTRNACQCAKCIIQYYPMAGTIFHKSTTPLSDWFRLAVQLKSSPDTTVFEIAAALNVTCKTALRLRSQLLKYPMLSQLCKKLGGIPFYLNEFDYKNRLSEIIINTNQENRRAHKTLRGSVVRAAMVKHGNYTREQLTTQQVDLYRIQMLNRRISIKVKEVQRDRI